MRKSVFAIVAALACSVAACQKQEAPKSETTADKPHAATAVVPGSHDDWCDEHQVPESLCTRCNPKLIAAFKATGDWCDEHSVPESQCKLCNPDLKIERPPRAPEGAK